MDSLKHHLWLPMIVLTGLLAACGGGGGGSDPTVSDTSSTGINTGVAVDPYIVNAQFEELAADGQTVIQRSSTYSSASGEFSFPNDLSDGSLIRIKASARGQHASSPYTGIIKRQLFVGDQQPIVVSPLTTWIANGMSPAAVIQAMNNAGLPGLNEASLYADPMAPLLNQSGSVTDADLVLLQANMAANAFMEATQNFDYNGTSTAGAPVTLADMAAVVKETLNPGIHQQLADSIGNDFTVGDLAETTAIFCRTVVNQIRQEITAGSPSVPRSMVDQFMITAMAETHDNAVDIYHRRTGGGATPPPTSQPDGQALFAAGCTGCHTVGTGSGTMDLAGNGPQVLTRFANGASHNGRTLAADEITAVTNYLDSQSGPVPDPGGGIAPPPTSPPDGQALFNTDCAVCHTVGTGTGFMDLAGDGPLVQTRFASGASHNGRTLTADEITAVADYFNSQSGPAPNAGGGTTPPSGSELYATECQGCHGSLQTSDIGDRTAAGIQGAIDGNLGGMGSLVLSTAETQAIADALAATTPPPPPPTPPQDRTGQQVYDQECAGCHSLVTHDTSGSFDLAGAGALIVTKIQGGHNNKIISATELTALADFADTFAPPSGGGGDPVTGSCDSCHGQPPAGNSFPNTAGAHGVHTALNGVGTACDSCHTGAAHNSWVDLGFPAKWNAKSGAATDNMDGTCSNISCHGGQKTPDWSTGTIDVDTQCQSCHSSGTAQYNGYYSGEHRKHVVDKGFNCSVCHDVAKLGTGHFGNLVTTTFEQAPAATIKSSLSYSNGTCLTAGCHGSESW